MYLIDDSTQEGKKMKRIKIRWINSLSITACFVLLFVTALSCMGVSTGNSDVYAADKTIVEINMNTKVINSSDGADGMASFVADGWMVLWGEAEEYKYIITGGTVQNAQILVNTKNTDITIRDLQLTANKSTKDEFFNALTYIDANNGNHALLFEGICSLTGGNGDANYDGASGIAKNIGTLNIAGKATIRGGKGGPDVDESKYEGTFGGEGIVSLQGPLNISGAITILGGDGNNRGGASAIHVSNGSLNVSGSLTATGGDGSYGGYGISGAPEGIEISGTLSATGGIGTNGHSGAGVFSNGTIRISGILTAASGNGSIGTPAVYGKANTVIFSSFNAVLNAKDGTNIPGDFLDPDMPKIPTFTKTIPGTWSVKGSKIIAPTLPSSKSINAIISNSEYTTIKLNKVEGKAVSLPTATEIDAGQALSSSKLTGGKVDYLDELLPSGGEAYAGTWNWDNQSQKPNSTGLQKATFTPAANANSAYLQPVKANVNVEVKSKMVSPPPPASAVKFAQKNVYLKRGKSATLKANVYPENAIDKKITWKSSDTKVATVDKNGKVTANKKKTGSATITANTVNGKTASYKVTVVKKDTKMKKFKLNKSAALPLVAGKTFQLKATPTPAKATSAVITYSSNKSSVAKVDAAGRITAGKPGTATITAKMAGKKIKLTVRVGTVGATKIKLNKTNISLKAKMSYTLIVKSIAPKATSPNTITWKSSNKKIATVNSKGAVKGIKKGKVTITATTWNGKTAKCKVTVK